MSASMVKVICDVHIVPDRVIVRAGTTVHVVRRFDKENYRGQPTLLALHDSVAHLVPDGFYLRGWEYTTDLNADLAPLQAARIENEIRKGYEEWSTDERRARSGEWDSGGAWTLHGDRNEWRKWSVSWIGDTGELYARNERDDEYIVLAVTRANDLARSEFLLEGWSNPDSAIYDNLTALREQIVARQDLPTPKKFVDEQRKARQWS